MRLAHTLPASAVLLALVAPGRNEELSFHPAQGSELERRFHWKASGAVDDLEVTANEQTVDPALLQLPPDLEFDFEASYGVHDEFEKMDGERPLVLLRHFLEASMHGSGPEGETSEDGTLNGKSVRFSWNEESDEYERSWVGEEGKDEELERLTEDLDLRALLPGKEVGAGDEWQVEGFPLWSAVVPGLDLELAFELKLEPDEEVPEAVKEEIRRFFKESGATCGLVSVQAGDTGSTAEVAFSSKIEHRVTLDPSVFGENMPEEVEFQDIELRLELSIQGTLLWDLDGGHFTSFTYELEAELEGEITGRVPSADLTLEMSAKCSAEVSFEGTAGAP